MSSPRVHAHYWSGPLRGKEVSWTTETTSAFLRKQLSEGVSRLPPPHKCQLAWSLGRGSGREKNKAQGFLSFSLHCQSPLCVSSCLGFLWWWTKAGRWRAEIGICQRPPTLPRPGLQELICQCSGWAPTRAHLSPLSLPQPLNTNSQLCSQENLGFTSLSLAAQMCS